MPSETARCRAISLNQIGSHLSLTPCRAVRLESFGAFLERPGAAERGDWDCWELWMTDPLVSFDGVPIGLGLFVFCFFRFQLSGG